MQATLSEQAETAIRMVREAHTIVYDTETSGVDWKRNFPVGHVIGSDPHDVVYIPIRHGGGGNLPDPDNPQSPPTEPDAPYRQHSFEAELARAFDSRRQWGSGTGPVIGHNLKFDCHMAANVGIMLGRNLSCTQNNQALINEYTKSFSLDSVAQLHGVTAKKGQELYDHIAAHFGCPNTKDAMSYFWRLGGGDPVAVDYAVGDGITTFELYQKQAEELAKQDLVQIWQVENRLIWTLFRMERRGMRVDKDYLHQLLEYVENEVKRAREQLPSGFNVRSPKDVREYVEQFRDDWPVTEKGNPSFTEKWLKSFPEGEHIVTVRKWSNLANTFVRPLIEEHVINGRVHTSFNQNKTDDHGTVSGRLSSSNPNLQNIPKHDKMLAKLFRRAFLPDPGMLLCERDYSQMEPRMYAHYSGEPALIDGYNSDPPKDVHTIVAELFNADRGTTAKRMNMGMFTGMFPDSFAEHMGISREEAKRLWDEWFAQFPKIRDFQNKAKARFKSRGYVKSVLGRRARLEAHRFAYRAVSRIIQNGGADILKSKMVEVDEMLEAEGDQSQLLVSVHDSFVDQSPDNEHGRAMSAEISRILEDLQAPPFNFRVPFPVEEGYGYSWAEASFGEDVGFNWDGKRAEGDA